MEHLRRLGYYLSIVPSIKKYKGYWVRLEHIVIILICGSFCGLTKLEEIYDYAKSKPARKMLREVFKIYLIPSYSHFLRLLKLIDADELNEVFIAWCRWIVYDLKKKTISLDGKTVKSTANMKEYERPLHIVSAVIAENGLTIGQLATDSKSNEIPAVQELIYYTRNEWSVETMHWLLDVNLKEDSSRVRNKNTQIVLNIFRKIVLNCLVSYKTFHNSKTAISKIMRTNLFDTAELVNILSDTAILANVTN